LAIWAALAARSGPVSIFFELGPDRTVLQPINNFFTHIRLFEKLCKKEININGTAKVGSEVSKELTLLRECAIKEKNFGLRCNEIHGNVNCIGFIDMRGGTIITTIHDPLSEPPVYFPCVKRPGVCLRTAIEYGVADKPTDSEWLLMKLLALDDYNKHMGG
jgi:hypothetical protein